jgi:glutaredoxin-related protein
MVKVPFYRMNVLYEEHVISKKLANLKHFIMKRDRVNIFENVKSHLTFALRLVIFLENEHTLFVQKVI